MSRLRDIFIWGVYFFFASPLSVFFTEKPDIALTDINFLFPKLFVGEEHQRRLGLMNINECLGL